MSEEILFYAFRYALPRSTKAVDVVVDYMVTNWDSLEENLRLMIVAEIRLATHTSRIKKTWLKVLDLGE